MVFSQNYLFKSKNHFMIFSLFDQSLHYLQKLFLKKNQKKFLFLQ